MSLSNPAGSKLNAVESRDAGKALSLSGMARNGKSFELFVPLESCPGAASQCCCSKERDRIWHSPAGLVAGWGQDISGWSDLVDRGDMGDALRGSGHEGNPSQLIIRFELDGASSSRGTLLVDNLQIRCLRPQSERSEN